MRSFIKTGLFLGLFLLTALPAAAQCRDCIVGKVKNEKGKSMEAVTVTVRQDGKDLKSVETDSKGKFQLTDLAPGLYNLVFEKAGYSTGILKNVEVRRDKRNNLDDRLVMKVDRGTLVIVEASVFNQNGFSLQGAKVVIEEVLSDGTTKKLDSGYSSRDGDIIFRFPEKATTYRVTASVKGLSAAKDVEVNEAAIYRTSITLDLSRDRDQ